MTVTTKVSFLLTYVDLHINVGMCNQYVVICSDSNVAIQKYNTFTCYA